MKKVILWSAICSLLLTGCMVKPGHSQARYDELEEEIADLKDEVYELKTEIADLEDQIRDYEYGYPADYDPDFWDYDRSQLEAMADLIDYQIFETSVYLVAVIEYSGDDPIPCLEMEATFYDSSHNEIFQRDFYVDIISKDNPYVMEFSYPFDHNYDYVEYDHYEIDFICTNNADYRENLADQLTVGTPYESGGYVEAEVTNDSSETINMTEIFILYYKDDQLIGHDWDYTSYMAPGETSYAYFYPPYDEDYNDLDYDRCETIVNGAYVY